MTDPDAPGAESPAAAAGWFTADVRAMADFPDEVLETEEGRRLAALHAPALAFDLTNETAWHTSGRASAFETIADGRRQALAIVEAASTTGGFVLSEAWLCEELVVSDPALAAELAEAVRPALEGER